jgi:hypothetical protein
MRRRYLRRALRTKPCGKARQAEPAESGLREQAVAAIQGTAGVK